MIPPDAIDAVSFTRFDRRPWLSLDRFLTMLNGLTIAEHPYAYRAAIERGSRGSRG